MVIETLEPTEIEACSVDGSSAGKVEGFGAGTLVAVLAAGVPVALALFVVEVLFD
jgi:hypothetical protein